MPIIEVEDLVKVYPGGVRAVDRICFTVEKGEVFGFLGPNGAGKTTVIKMLCTLLKPTAGHASVAGHDVRTEPDAVRASLGIDFQDPSLDERLTGLENLRFHCMMYHVPHAEREARIRRVLEMVELLDVKDHIVKTYSGGMKRRLEIARGLLHYPQVLFLDEPTLGLDPQTRSHIWSYLHELRAREGITIFMTTHYMDEAEHCDRIAIIDHGRIIALDSPAALKRQIRHDVITLTTVDNDQAIRELEDKFGLTARRDGRSLELEVPDGDSFLPRLSRGLETEILTITLRKPTLDDVFLQLLGRAIRPEEADSHERLKYAARRRGRIR